MNKALLILIFLMFAPLLLATEKAKKDTVSIEEVYVVRVKPSERDVSTASLQTILGKEIDRISGCSAADAVKNFSAVGLRDYGGLGGIKTLMVRSMGANHTGIFVDGVQFSDAATGQVDVGKIAIDNVESVSLYIGQPANILQPARMFASASVLSIQSVMPDKLEKRVAVRAAIKTGSFGLFNPSLMLQNKLGKSTWSDVSFNYSKADGVYPFVLNNGTGNESVEYRRNSSIEAWNMNANVLNQWADSSRLTCKIYTYNSQRGLPGAVVFYNPYASQKLWNNDFFTNIKFETGTAGKVQWLSNAKFSQNYLRYVDPDFLNSGGKLDNSYTQREYYASQAVLVPLSSAFKISMATDLIANTLDANLYEYARPTRFTSLTAIALQYNFAKLETNASILGTIVREKTVNGIAASDRNVLTPSFAASYLLFRNPSVRLRAFYKDIFRMPTFNDLYYSQVGNVALDPEWAKQYNVGISAYWNLGFLENISLKTDVFHHNIKDKIVAVPTKNLFVWSMRNIGLVETNGIELQSTLQTRDVANFRLIYSCNYSYQQALDVTDKESNTYKQQIPYIPFETFSSLSTIEYKTISISWNALFNGYRYVLGENIYDNMLPSWWVHDLTLLYKIKVKTVSLKLKGELSNVLNHQYEVVRSFPMPGRSFTLSFSINY